MKDYEKLSMRHFDRQAKDYDRKDTVLYSREGKISCRDIAEQLREKEWNSLLDVGCGTGWLIDLLAKEREASYTGLDLSTEMINEAKKKEIKGASFVQGKADALPFEDMSFDIVTCSQSFHHYPSQAKSMREAWRVLKEDGLYILSDTGIGNPGAWLDNHIFFKLSTTGDCYTQDKEHITKMMQENGFDVIDCRQISGMIYTVTGRKKKEKPLPAVNYKNWVPKEMTYGLLAGSGVLCTAALLTKNKAVKTVLGAGALAAGAAGSWCAYAASQFSYDGKRKMAAQIIEGTASYITLPEGGKGLDVGCGSGALTIACAKRNPNAQMIGIDRWGIEYSSFSKRLCEENAEGEGVSNVSFAQGDACHLDFADETFDAVTSNYVYHNISGMNKQRLLRETLRVLKKGGTFAIHDIMSRERYGDMQKFIQELKEEGYEDVRLIPTDRGMFMNRKEAVTMMLSGSALLVGRK